MKITNEVLEAHLNCKTKGHLKLGGESGVVSDYEAMTTEVRRASREAALARLVARFGQGDACRGVLATAAMLKQGSPMLVDAVLEAEGMSLRLDALQWAEGASELGGHHSLPVRHVHGDKVRRQQKIVLAVFGLALARVQRLRPATGLVARGLEGRLGKVKLDAKLYRQAEQVLEELNRLKQGGEPPRLILNKHCGREGTEAVQPQGHLHPDTACLHLPPQEDEAGSSEEARPFAPGARHPREHGLRRPEARTAR
jgi:predicted RecB family nuclease